MSAMCTQPVSMGILYSYPRQALAEQQRQVALQRVLVMDLRCLNPTDRLHSICCSMTLTLPTERRCNNLPCRQELRAGARM